MKRYRNKGFSLLETLAAMLLLALCFGALMRAASASMALHVRAAEYTQASLWAGGLLDRVFLVDFPEEGEHHGAFDATYRWTMRVSAPPQEEAMVTSAPLRLYRIELVVEWNEGGRTLSSRFVTLRSVSTKPAVPRFLLPPVDT
jgi:general secretion pathway protein I